jgi:hydrogenase maturation protein HypF
MMIAELSATSDGRGVAAPGDSEPPRERLRLAITGAVQGVGYRPFVYRLATELGLDGWVRNDSHGVVVEVAGTSRALRELEQRLRTEAPPAAVVQSVSTEWTSAVGPASPGFRIVASERQPAPSAVILPDLAICDDCRRDILDPQNRRYRYPFTTCTNCGPRFTIVEDLPYDRPLTSMRGFAMCPACAAEYADPLDRRFHAQPIACPDCGPQLALVSPAGHLLASRETALTAAVAALRGGQIVALKGLGGYQLLVDARNEAAVATLRQRKQRPHKPLAVMVADLAAARELAVVDRAEAELLASRMAPIVLLARLPDGAMARSVAPDTPRFGLMLPTTPLHHLLLAGFGGPLVATSGNVSEEPIVTDDDGALRELAGVADSFLRHDRPIVRQVDDSVVWVLGGTPRLVRRARGFAPLPVMVSRPVPPLLAVGAHQKVAAALAMGRQVFVSQHVSDMETPAARAAFERVIDDFLRLYAAAPVAIAHDLHPDYPTTRWALGAAAAAGGVLARHGRASAALTAIAVQHHHAHFAACLADNERPLDGDGPGLGLTWDGTGFGADGTVWGGEALVGDAGSFTRLARLRPFRLPGGEAAVREPRRVALALLHQLFGDDAAHGEGPNLAGLPRSLWNDLARDQREILARMLERGLRSPWTSSMGRLFDGVAALLGLPGRVSFEGEAAAALEALADPAARGPYPFPFEVVPAPSGLAPGQSSAENLVELDWRPLVIAILGDLGRELPRSVIAGRFHHTLALAAVALARRADVSNVALSGGCFQNRLLTTLTAEALGTSGFNVLLHRQVPANDGGIALGQIVVGAARLLASPTLAA